MNFIIVHELPGRIRLRNVQYRFAAPEAAVVKALLETQDWALSVAVSYRTGSILICYNESCGARDTLLAAVSFLDRDFYSNIDATALVKKTKPTLCQLITRLAAGVIFRSTLPVFIYRSLTFIRSLPILRHGTRSFLRRGFSTVSVLDAAAIAVSLVRLDFRTVSVITSLLALGDILESWTHNRSKESLANILAIRVDKLWVRGADGTEIEIPIAELSVGDIVIIRSGSVIPVDGVVVDGAAMVNQASMTGEAALVNRSVGLSVFAGTVVEDGAIAIRVTAFDKDTRIHKITQMINDSEALKAEVQMRAERRADTLVPYNFLLAGMIFAFTGSLLRASSALLVDYSCAIKLATPLAILSAMREGAQHGMLVKGGKFLEAVSLADTIVFDKTGTLTLAAPVVAKVVPLGQHTREQVLRTAACLEEHFPHSIARAVVRQAEIEALPHMEEHTEVEYVMAHGIVTRQHGERVMIGSSHFIFDDEGISCTAGDRLSVELAEDDYTVLCLAVGDSLAGIICIEDQVREEAPRVITELRELGFKRMVLLTGDNARAAANAAMRVGIDDVRSQLLPEDKTKIIHELKSATSRVVMIGDGVNDSPSLAAADVGVSLKSGADIAQEVADIVLADNNLYSLVNVRRLGTGTMKKIYNNYALIVGANSLLLILGLTGMITPSLSALLHNLTTVGASVYSLTPVLNIKNKNKTKE